MSYPLVSPIPCEEVGLNKTSIPSNPWKKAGDNETSPSNQNKSFLDVMSEDMAKDMQEREEREILEMNTAIKGMESPFFDFEGSAADTSSDFLLAVTLQQEFNKEHNTQVQREEKHLNKNSKLSVSFCKYRVCQDVDESDSDEEDFWLLNDENRALDSFEENRRTDPTIPPCGYTMHNNKMVTKHDSTLAGRKNAEKVMNFPPGINTGDGGGFDMRISNKVYNNLAKSAQMETRRKQRVKDKVDKATAEKALDPKTRLIIYKMVNNSTLESVNSIVSTGKESVVFHATGGSFEEVDLPHECAVKVFKTTLTDFKTRERYIKEDYRFKDRMSKNNNRMMIRLWAEKEFHNLRRLQKAQLPSPSPLLIRKHALVMSFIGEGQLPAPKLKHVSLSSEEWASAYQQVVDIMVKMYRDCNLIHGDLSEYNLLWFEEKCWVIDVGQAVEPVHPNALRFLYRDCSNVVGFFKSRGVKDVVSPLKLFEQITGIKFSGPEEDAERMIDEYENHQDMWREGALKGEGDHFDFVWNEVKNRTIDNETDETNVDIDEAEGSAPKESLDEEEVDLEVQTNKDQSVLSKSQKKKKGKKSKNRTSSFTDD